MGNEINATELAIELKAVTEAIEILGAELRKISPEAAVGIRERIFKAHPSNFPPDSLIKVRLHQLLGA